MFQKPIALTPLDTFKQTKAHYDLLHTSLNRKYNTLAGVRILLFLSSIILIVVFANFRIDVGIGVTLILFPFIFGFIVRSHNKLKERRDMAHFTTLVNQDEINRVNNNLAGIDDGEMFMDKKHPYLHDLDIFGKNSLYQLVNRAVSPSGRHTLAKWLSAPATEDAILERQEAVKEMVPMLSWRQSFQASGKQQDVKDKNFSTLLQWINEPDQLINNRTYKVLSYMLPLATIILILLNIYADLNVYFTVALLVINGIVLKKFAGYAKNITEKTFDGIQTLRAYGRMISQIESTAFESATLKDLRHVFVHENFKASGSIAKLQKILDFLQSRSNMFYVFFNFVLLFDLHLVFRAEKWKRQQKADVNQWFDNIGKLEAINSLAGFAYANPEYVLPVISNQPYIFIAKSLGHPLIPKAERITNDLEMTGKGTIDIITGSNMSGKSTFLRTIGVNAVLALAGAPVCAKRLELSRMQVFTSMRTEDNLEEHVSSFYAELRRIKMLLEILEEKTLPVMFMLDEILKGTNSKDRHAGAAALIHQISDADAMGFVSTHDLELGQLTESLSNVKNFSFNSIVAGDEIIFNYTLEEGICNSFNASKLMEKIGIKMD